MCDISFSSSVLAGSQYLAMDPAVPGVFTSPYPFGIDPVWPSHSFNIHTVVLFVAAPVLILSRAVSTDLGDGKQQAKLLELV